MLRFRHAVMALALTLTAGPALAFQFEEGEWRGSFDTTISLGGLYRLSSPDSTYIGRANGGTQNSVNTDDGDLNYDKGWVSSLIKASHDFQLTYRNYGMFVRGYYFNDFKSDTPRRTALSDQAKDRVVQGAELLDMYVYGQFDVGDMPVDLRFGRQVLSLGESTFIPNGNNVVNPVDLSKLRVPGAELKEAFLPVNMLKASIGLTDNITIEPFWLLEFRRNELEPAGTYFSTNDFASRGGEQVWLGFGGISDQTGASGTGLGGILRDKDHEYSNLNQYGISAHVYMENGLDLGLYYARFHSRSPVISARTPTAPIDTNLTGPLTAVFVRAGLPAAQAAAQAAGVFQLIVLSQTNPAALSPVQIATLQAAQTQAAIAGARQIALLTAAGTGRYFVEYPEDLTMLGASFNTDLASTGISLQGEVSYKQDVPLQVDDVELLFAALSTLNPAFGANNQVGNYLGKYGQEISGYRRHGVWTGQATATKVFGQVLGASQLALVTEAGGVYIPDLPGKDKLRYDVNGTFTSGNGAAMVGTGSTLPGTPLDQFADPFSWGYQILGRLDYTNLFGGVNVSPSVAFVHDVSGNTPNPLGNFIENRQSLNVSVEVVWQNRWSAEFRYVNFYGGGTQNLLADRDFFATTLKYAF